MVWKGELEVSCLNLILELSHNTLIYDMRNKECAQSLKVFCSTSYQGITFIMMRQSATNNDFIRKNNYTYFIEVQEKRLTKAQESNHLSYI
jgi:hypothetical protein